MEFHWIRHEGNPCLILFVLGWAADHRCVEHIVPDGCDVAAVYDYREIAYIDRSLFEAYAQTYLFAWSFGVWAAEKLLGGVELHKAVALNGTPMPLDGRYGLEPRRAAVTLHGINKGGMEQFNRRTYGEHYESLKETLSPRTDGDNIVELEKLIELSSVPYTPAIGWTKAVVGERDMIFPPENMKFYWQGLAESLPLPHYPFGDPDVILREIDY